jgi:hypothetical protein
MGDIVAGDCGHALKSTGPPPARLPLLWGRSVRLLFQGAGTRCGRTYDAGTAGALSLAQIEKKTSLASGAVPDPIVAVGHVPPVVGRPLLAAAAPKATLHEGEAGAPCSMAVFLRTGADAYTSYGLVGGP